MGATDAVRFCHSRAEVTDINNRNSTSDEHPYPEGVTSYNKTRPMQVEEFATERAWWGDEADGFKARKETPQAWKVSLEDIAARNYNLDTVIFRPSAVYGPLDANNRVIQKFIRMAMEGKPLTDGRSKRLIAYHEVGHALVGTLVRWFESYQIAPDIGHVPVSNLYEVFVLFSWVTALFWLYYEDRFARAGRELGSLGAFVMLLAQFAVALRPVCSSSRASKSTSNTRSVSVSAAIIALTLEYRRLAVLLPA